MAFLQNLKEAITGKEGLKNAFFLKETSDSKDQLKRLENMYQDTSYNEIKELIEQDIRLLTYGNIGEESVIFELKNSFIPMIVIRDLRLVYEELSAQIDYLIVTKKFVLVIECKNLYGNIEVNNSGDFIRTIEYKGKKKKEGIYSPLTQNLRHLEIIKQIRKDQKSNFIAKSLFEKNFDNFYKSVVILANPKTVIDTKYAKKEMKSQIKRCDELNSFIKMLLSESKNVSMSDDEMFAIAQSFLDLHSSNENDYMKKYEKKIKEKDVSLKESDEYNEKPAVGQENLEKAPVYKELKMYRLEKSKSENIKAYYVFNNSQMEELIRKMPLNVEELMKVSGFAEGKCEKYGNDIIAILDKYRLSK